MILFTFLVNIVSFVVIVFCIVVSPMSFLKQFPDFGHSNNPASKYLYRSSVEICRDLDHQESATISFRHPMNSANPFQVMTPIIFAGLISIGKIFSKWHWISASSSAFPIMASTWGQRSRRLFSLTGCRYVTIGFVTFSQILLSRVVGISPVSMLLKHLPLILTN